VNTSTPTPAIHLPETDSTNAEVMRRALAGSTLPFWVRADRQTRGRGRSGRPWQSQFAGNLYASFGLALACRPDVAAQLSLVTGVAVIDAIRSVGSAPDSGAPNSDEIVCDLQLKWPNDILIGGAKTGGILIESTTIRGTLIAVIGIGINLVASPDDTGRSVSSLNLHKIQTNPHVMLNAVRQHMDHWLAIWQEGAGFASCRAAWTSRAMAFGTELSINAGAGPVSGSFQGLDEDGALLLQTSSGRQRFTFGDVTFGSQQG
jgi:BirA family transcriptional regulator, biotin operon repressor / biotin---[acetyl-CoA-carboxylase] ligase